MRSLRVADASDACAWRDDRRVVLAGATMQAKRSADAVRLR